jgi:hypothetical protein
MIFLADLIVVVHLAFIAFVLLGGLLALKWRWVVWLHLPAAVWGGLVEAMGWYCPLTPLEYRLRAAGGAEGYSGAFVERYLLPLVYPAELTRELQLVLAAIVIMVNVAIYVLLWRRRQGVHS